MVIHGGRNCIPFDETNFASGHSSITRMLRDNSGVVTGYEVLYGFEHAVGGQWYQGTRVGDLPREFYENLAVLQADPSE